jgi:hypothetical protein
MPLKLNVMWQHNMGVHAHSLQFTIYHLKLRCNASNVLTNEKFLLKMRRKFPCLVVIMHITLITFFTKSSVGQNFAMDCQFCSGELQIV